MSCMQLRIVLFFTFLCFVSFSAVAKDDWNLVFKVATGGVGNVYDLYTSKRTMNLNNRAAQSLAIPIQEHFKSEIINNWSESGIIQVRVALYKDGAEVAHFLFDGQGSNSTSWFSIENLINSSYTDLLQESDNSVPINFFSIEGIKHDTIARRFYINSEWAHCPGDSGWLMIIDKDATGVCPNWEIPYLQYKPAILYSPLSTRAVYDKEFQNILADSLTVSIKYDYSNLTCFSVCSRLIQMDAATYCHKPCSYSTNLDEKIEQLRKELAIDKKTTSSYRRSLVSVYEDRTSAKSMGLTGVAVIVSVLVFPVLIDCLRFATCMKNKISPKKPKPNKTKYNQKRT